MSRGRGRVWAAAGSGSFGVKNHGEATRPPVACGPRSGREPAREARPPLGARARLQQQRLEAREAGADAQVDLLPGFWGVPVKGSGSRGLPVSSGRGAARRAPSGADGRDCERPSGAAQAAARRRRAAAGRARLPRVDGERVELVWLPQGGHGPVELPLAAKGCGWWRGEEDAGQVPAVGEGDGRPATQGGVRGAPAAAEAHAARQGRPECAAWQAGVRRGAGAEARGVWRGDVRLRAPRDEGAEAGAEHREPRVCGPADLQHLRGRGARGSMRRLVVRGASCTRPRHCDAVARQEAIWPLRACAYRVPP
jgi:hypothetical protein